MNNHIKILARETYTSGIVLLLILGLVVPMCMAVIFFAKSFYNSLSPISLLAIFLAAAIMTGVFFLLRWKPNNYQLIIVLSALIAIVILGRIFFAFSFDQEYYSDFRKMWNFACRISESGNWIPPDRPQTERPLPVFVPLTFLFGCSDTVFKIFNICAITIASILIALIAKDLIGKSAAVASFVLLSFVPESYFFSLIPSHDVPGLLFISIYIFVVHLLLHRNCNISLRKIIFYGGTLGLLGLMLHIQRGLFYPLYIAVALYLPLVIFKNKKLQTHRVIIFFILTVLVIPLMTVSSVTNSLESKRILYDRDKPNSIYSVPSIYRFGTSMTSGTGSSGITFYNRYARGQQLETNRYYAKAFLYTDIYREFKRRPSHYINKLKRLTGFGTQDNFYYSRLKGVSRDDQIKLRRKFRLINKVFWHVLSIVSLISIVYLIIKRSKSDVHVGVFLPTIFGAIVIFAIGLIGENQPRYVSFLPWMIVLPIMAMMKNFAEPKKSVSSLFHDKFFSCMSWVLLFMVLFFILKFARFYISKSEYLLVNMSKPHIECVGISKEMCIKARIFPKTSDARRHSNLTIYHPTNIVKGNSVKASYELPSLSKKSHALLSFYVQTPYKRIDKKVGFFDINILVDGILQKKFNLSDNDKFHYNEIKIEGTGKPIYLTFEIVSNFDSGSALTWTQASTANFRFLSLRTNE